MHVERDDLRTEVLELLQRLHAIAREPNLEIELVLENAAEQLADEGGVIDDEYLDHAFARPAF